MRVDEWRGQHLAGPTTKCDCLELPSLRDCAKLIMAVRLATSPPLGTGR